MAYNTLTKVGYGQLELNNVAFRRDGRIEAQCALDATDFANIPAQNGMALVVDKVAGIVRFSDGADETGLIALHYSAEHMYEDKEVGLKDFALERGSFLPRMGYLAVADLFTTNTVGYDTGVFANEAAVDTALVPATLAATPVYAIPHTDGTWKLVKTISGVSGVIAKVVKKTTMPDGQKAVQLQVISL